MALTAEQIGNAANALLDFHMDKGGKPYAQALEDQPMTAALIKAQKTFPGGKGFITGKVKGDYTTEYQGYKYDDPVKYKNPSNIKKYKYPWYELHAGIEITGTELKESGITVIDTLTGENTANVSQQDSILLTNLLEDKIDDMWRGSAKSMDKIMHRDGSQDSKLPPGVLSFLSLTPNVGLTGSLDRATHTWWRNRALVGSNKIIHNTTDLTLIRTLKSEIRQLRRYGGSPNKPFAGSGAMNKLESEYVAKGQFTVTGYDGKTDIGIGKLSIRGLGEIVYDPTMDNEGLENYIKILDTNNMFPMVMEGEDNKVHAPARPADKYVFFRSITWTGALICRQLNSQGIYEVA